MKVLLIYDDLWHPAEVIDRGLKSFPARFDDYELDCVRTAKDILTPEFVQAFPVVIIAKGNAVNQANSAPWFEPTVTECMPEDFRAYVENGGGILFLHAGNVFSKKNAPEMTEINGNAFIGHPPRCLTHVEPVGEHPITAGAEAFDVRDEHYNIEILADDINVFLHTTSATGGDVVSGYTRTIGNGRVCVLTPGHTEAVFKDPNFQTILMNALDWCAGKI